MHFQSPSNTTIIFNNNPSPFYFPIAGKALLQFERLIFWGERHHDYCFYFLCIWQKGDMPRSHSGAFETSRLGSVWLLGWRTLVLELKAFLIVSVDSHTAMIGHGPGHRSYSCDDARCRIITENSVCGFSIFPSSTQDIYFTVTHRHTTVFLF